MSNNETFLSTISAFKVCPIVLTLIILISSCGDKEEIPNPINIKNPENLSSITSRTFFASKNGEELIKDEQIGGYTINKMNGGEIVFSDFYVLEDTVFTNSIYYISPSGNIDIRHHKQFPKEGIYENDKYVENVLILQPYNPNTNTGTIYQYIKDFNGRYVQQNNYNSGGSKTFISTKEYDVNGNILESVSYNIGYPDTLTNIYEYNVENRLLKSSSIINGFLSTLYEYEYEDNISIRRQIDSNGNFVDLEFVTTYPDSIKTTNYKISNGDTILRYYNLDYFENSNNELVTSYYFNIIGGFTREGNKEYDEYGNRVLDEQKVVYEDGRVFYNRFEDENFYYEDQLIKSKTNIDFENEKKRSVRYNDIGKWDDSQSNYKIYGYNFNDEPILFREYFIHDGIKNLQIFYDSICSINEVVWFFMSQFDEAELYEPYLHLDSRIKDISLFPESNIIFNYPSNSFINEYIFDQEDFIQKSYDDKNTYTYIYHFNNQDKLVNIEVENIQDQTIKNTISLSYDDYGNIESEIVRANNQIISEIKYEYEFDDFNNWTIRYKKVITGSENNAITERIISYI